MSPEEYVSIERTTPLFSASRVIVEPTTVEDMRSVASINPLNSVATAAAPIPVPGELT